MKIKNVINMDVIDATRLITLQFNLYVKQGTLICAKLHLDYFYCVLHCNGMQNAIKYC